MRYNISRVFGFLVGIPVAIIGFFISIFSLDIMFVFDALIGFVSFFIGYIPTQRLTSQSYLKEMHLSRKDYRYIHNQIYTASSKIKKILKSYINIRSIQDFRLVNDIYRLARTINNTVKQRPNQFFNIESFYYSHIDHALNLIDSYTRLAKMPMKSKDEKKTLQQTRITLEEVRRTLIADLKRLNAEDYDQLDTEIKLNHMYQQRTMSEKENEK
ncbi:5-bromo-4-chloroindolyl phosphate hydrolysis family protein [Staphylococcus sp. 11261D007BR]